MDRIISRPAPVNAKPLHLGVRQLAAACDKARLASPPPLHHGCLRNAHFLCEPLRGTNAPQRSKSNSSNDLGCARFNAPRSPLRPSPNSTRKHPPPFTGIGISRISIKPTELPTTRVVQRPLRPTPVGAQRPFFRFYTSRKKRKAGLQSPCENARVGVALATA
jgi:hypothetical protein